MPFGQKVELGLGTLKPPFAGVAARADGGFGLDNVPPGPQAVLLRVEQRQHALALILVHTELPQRPDTREHRDKGGDDIAPGQPREKQHHQPRRGYQQ